MEQHYKIVSSEEMFQAFFMFSNSYLDILNFDLFNNKPAQINNNQAANNPFLDTNQVMITKED